MKEEALKLADSIDEFAQGGYSYKPSNFLKVSDMIRRLVEELDYLKNQISFYELKDLGNQTKPLSDEEIKNIKEHLPPSLSKPELLMLFARAIEERHGIK